MVRKGRPPSRVFSRFSAFAAAEGSLDFLSTAGFRHTVAVPCIAFLLCSKAKLTLLRPIRPVRTRRTLTSIFCGVAAFKHLVGYNAVVILKVLTCDFADRGIAVWAME